MSNQEYIFQMIRANTRIYMDTATLMDTEGFALFMNNAVDILRTENKKIKIAVAVRSELARHLESTNRIKQALAMEAISIIKNYEDVFIVEGGTIDDSEIAKAFADAAILAELTLNKSSGTQLLITNDKKLSKDAYEINKLESCKGRKVMVCYIDNDGKLMRSNYMNDINEQRITDSIDVIPANDDYDETSKQEAYVSKVTDTASDINFLPLCTFVLGTILGGVGVKMVQRYV